MLFLQLKTIFLKMTLNKTIHLAADHRGFKLKEKIKEWLLTKKSHILDHGNKTMNPHDDYPDFAKNLAKKMKDNSNSTGICFCGTGTGMCIAVNKFQHIRGICCKDPDIVMLSRADNNANTLCLGSDWCDEEEAKDLINIWLNTPFSKDERHIRRINKVSNLNKNNQNNV